MLGPKTPRSGNVQLEYFAYALGRDAVDKRLVYAEGVFDVDGGLQVLATLVADRAAGRDVFEEEGRRERDFMADGAQAHLLRLFGKTGSDQASPRAPGTARGAVGVRRTHGVAEHA